MLLQFISYKLILVKHDMLTHNLCKIKISTKFIVLNHKIKTNKPFSIYAPSRYTHRAKLSRLLIL